MKLTELFETEEAEQDKIKNILTRIRQNPDDPGPWKEAMNLVLAGNKSPDLEVLIKSAVRNGIIDEFVDFMARADDKLFKKYSYLLTDEVKERFKRHPSGQLKLNKYQRTKDQKKADKTHDTFVFVGHDKFDKTEDGKFERKLDIESFVKIDKYALEDHQMINMMRMRARAHNAQLYIIRLPAGFIKAKVTHRLEPWLLQMIDDHKEKI